LADVVERQAQERHQPFFILVVVLVELDAQEDCPQRNRQSNQQANLARASQMRCSHGQRHCQTAGQQHEGIERAPVHVQVLAGVREGVWVLNSVHHVGCKDAAEEHYL
jgi:hypothetical protein